MMKRTIYQYMLLMMVALLAACEPNVDEFKPSNGTADFSKFIAIGDSYTAGYTDGALGLRGQQESFSYILGKQLMYVGSESFNQPLVQLEGSVGTTDLPTGGKNGYFELQVVNGALKPVPTAGNMNIFGERVYSADNQNFGIPGAKVIHMGNLAPYPAYPRLNPFYARFASSMDATVMGDALATQPTFVSLWLGNNDLLAYALAGGESDEITNSLVYAGALSNIVDAIQASGAEVVVGNIPAIAAIPYFNYILANGHIAFVIEDESAPGGIRQLVEGEKVLLSASTALGMGYGQSLEMPLPAKYVLDATELAAIESTRVEYNKSIKALAESKGLALADLAALMDVASTTGLLIDGNRYTSTFASGGVFSLDGIHATGRGSAIIANAFIDAINEQFNASVPRANINDYDMVKFP